MHACLMVEDFIAVYLVLTNFRSISSVNKDHLNITVCGQADHCKRETSLVCLFFTPVLSLKHWNRSSMFSYIPSNPYMTETSTKNCWSIDAIMWMLYQVSDLMLHNPKRHFCKQCLLKKHWQYKTKRLKVQTNQALLWVIRHELIIFCEG